MTSEVTETQIKPRGESPPLVQLLDQYEADLVQALPEGVTPGRFTSIVVNQVRQVPQLRNCEPMTVVSSVLLAAQLGLEPGAPTGLSWIIPRRNRGRMEASMQIGYQGLRQLAYRSGLVKRIEARIVHDGDDFDFAYGLGGANWTHRPTGEAGRDWMQVYCCAETITGAELFEAMSTDEIHEHRDRYVKDWKSNKAWKSNEPEMARKTVTARLCRQLPMSAEFRTAVVADGSTPRHLVPDLAGVMALEAGDDEAEEDNDE